MTWALGAMGYVPEKTWLRTFIGQVRSGGALALYCKRMKRICP